MLKNDQTLCLLFHFHLPILCVCVSFLQGNEEEFLIGQKRGPLRPIKGWRRIKNHSTLVESTKQNAQAEESLSQSVSNLSGSYRLAPPTKILMFAGLGRPFGTKIGELMNRVVPGNTKNRRRGTDKETTTTTTQKS
jgi:hypothetical protein